MPEIEVVMDELTAVLAELVDDPTVDLSDPVAVTEAIDRAAAAVGDRDPVEVERLVHRLDTVLALGRTGVEEHGLGEVS